MKKTLLLGLLLTAVLSCKKDTEVVKEETIKEIKAQKINLEIVRFDKAFFESTPQDVLRLKPSFPYLFPEGVTDQEWQSKLQDPLMRELYAEVKQAFPDNTFVEKEMTDLFKAIRYNFPNQPLPEKLVTVISEVDTDLKAIYTDSLALVSLDTYLGEKHRFYEGFPEYIRPELNRDQMALDMVSSFTPRVLNRNTDRTFLSLLIQSGKELYLKDVLLPEVSDAAKMAYTQEQIQWCEANETEMWGYFIEHKLLFDRDSKLASRFVTKSPFSKFYLEIDKESPGRVGTWIGWQIVRSFMKNNDVTLQQLLAMDAKTIFEKSKYKPKK